ncbi:MAG: AraC family transcriptional regulator [Alphaproteobacteria bacterium]|nr:AraC family transcriptional regulator [Alphaproteobacteria bacterium]
MTEPTIGAGYAKALLDVAVARGATRADLLANAQIADVDFADHDNRIPFSKYVALMRHAKLLCNDPALALHFGETMDLSEISVVGLICLASETMADAMAQMNRFGRLVIEVEGVGIGDRFQLSRDRRGLWFVDTRTNPNAFPELTESTFARMVCSARRLGVPQLARALHVTHAKPAHDAEYDRIFQTPVNFAADRNAYLMDEAVLAHRIATQPRYVFGVLSEHAATLLANLENAKSLRGRIESLLLPSLHTGEIGIDKIAGQLALSRQTLYRKLKAEGLTFETVLEDLRHKLALHYLSSKKVSVNETAYLVGFSDPAAFSRAFKRWTGKSPKEARG